MKNEFLEYLAIICPVLFYMSFLLKKTTTISKSKESRIKQMPYSMLPQIQDGNKLSQTGK